MNEFLKAFIIRSAKFWCAALKRAIRTVAQAALSTIGCSAVVLSDVNWRFVLSASLFAGIMSLITSIATGLPEAEGDKNE